MLKWLDVSVGTAAASQAAIRTRQAIQRVATIETSHRSGSSDGRVTQVDRREQWRRRHSPSATTAAITRLVPIKFVSDHVVGLQQCL